MITSGCADRVRPPRACPWSSRSARWACSPATPSRSCWAARPDRPPAAPGSAPAGRAAASGSPRSRATAAAGPRPAARRRAVHPRPAPPGPLVLLLCRFVPGGRMAAGYHAGRSGYPIRLSSLYDGAARRSRWATYGGLVGHVGGTAVTQSAWRLFAVAAMAAVIFGTAGWILALSSAAAAGDGRRGRPAADDRPAAARRHHCSSCCISWRAASAIEPDSDG